VNNTNDWVNGQQLKFSAGTIKVDQEWMVNFTLRVLTEGNIKVFNKSSKVTFTGIVGEVGIPDTYITAVPFGTEKGPEDIDFQIKNLHRNEESDTKIAHLAWEFVYTGSDSKIDWTIYLKYPNSDVFGQVEFLPDKERGWDPFYNLDITNLKPGQYTIKVRGHVYDAPDDEKSLTFIILGPTATPQILIQ